MKSLTNDHFWKCYAGLPQDVRRQAKEAYTLFAKDSYYLPEPSLQAYPLDSADLLGPD